MPRNDFDPLDQQPSTDQPLHDYLQPPPYLGVLATVQFVLAGLMVLAWILTMKGATATPWAGRLALLLPPLLLTAAGLGLSRRSGWGWWLTSTLYYCVFFNLPVNLVLWTTGRQPFSLGVNLVVFALAVVVLVCLTRPELLRFIRFSSPDGRASRRMMLSPVLIGIAWSLLHLIVAVVRSR